MKYLLTLMILCSCNLVFAQNYLESNPEWMEYFVICGGGNPYCTSTKYSIKLDGDTIINNIVYFKTRRQGISTTWDWTVDTLVSEDPIDSYLYPLREEQGKFYIYHTSQDEEQLLHDFNLTVGDTAISVSFCPNPQIVLAIDTLYFGTQMRKRFLFSAQLFNGSSPLIEGIGSSRGLFVRPCNGVVGIESGSSLRCYTSGDETLQVDTLGQCETTPPVIVSTKNIIINEYNIHPNPFDEKIIIENSFQESDKVKIKLYDFHGHLIQSSSKMSIGNTIEISTRAINSGMYVLVISTKDEIHSIKMIKL